MNVRYTGWCLPCPWRNPDECLTREFEPHMWALYIARHCEGHVVDVASLLCFLVIDSVFVLYALYSSSF